MRCAVFDIDNTLFDARNRFEVAISRFGVRSPRELPFELQKEFWRDFMDPSLLKLDRPLYRAIEMVHDAKKRGLRVVLITGRYEWLRRDTILQLMAAGIPFDELVMRPNDNYQVDRELKPSLVRKLGCEVVEYHDDDLETLLEVRKIFPEALLFLHRPDGTFEMLVGKE
ncbi:MAG: HAD family acid phosphatase [Candidatus Korarchaeota archaeon]|nr:HAD family acid phosphatase [Candidatus Korarchaeota archaeon]